MGAALAYLIDEGLSATLPTSLIALGVGAFGAAMFWISLRLLTGSWRIE